MKRSIFIIGFFAIAFILFVIATMPIGFVLEKSGAKRAGLSWQSTNGSIFKGEVAGFSFARQPVGTVELSANLFALLKGQLGYHVIWNGQPGNGTGYITVGRTSISVSEFDGVFNLAAFNRLVPDIRRTNSIISIQGGAVSLGKTGCTVAAGELNSDVLARFAANYDVSATDLNGTVSCDAGTLRVVAEGQMAEQDIITAELRLGLKRLSTVRAHVQTDDALLVIGLADYGFQEDATGVVYRKELSLLEGF